MVDAARLDWRWCPFAALTPRELDGIFAARQRVFVVEQGCAYLDADGFDDRALHLAAWPAVGREPFAYARVLEPGSKYPCDVSIGRVITATPARGKGLGRELMARTIALALEHWPRRSIRISAQSRLERFYEGFGFAIVGARYLEDGIDHTEMLRPAGSHPQN